MDNLNFNIFNVLILTGIIHGLIFSTIVFINRNLKSNTNYLLVFTILSLAFSNLQYWFIDTGIIPRYFYDKNYLLFIPFEFLMLPFFFLFVKSYLNRVISKYEKAYLFTPFILCILYLFFRAFLNTDLKITKIFNLVIEYMSILFSVAIIILVFRMILIYERGNSNYSMSNVIIETKWLKKILYIGLLLCILWFVSLSLFEGFFNKGYYKFYSLWIGMAILIYWMGYSAILQKQLFNERKEIRKRKISNNDENPSSYSKIDSLIVNGKLHLNPTLSLKTLSKELNLSEGYISQLINKNSSLNFNDYINSIRVNDVKEMLVDNQYDNYTITSIGLEAGFNSKSSFYTAFKKNTGQTPIEYKKSVRNL